MNIYDIFETCEVAVAQGIYHVYVQISKNINYTGRMRSWYIK